MDVVEWSVLKGKLQHVVTEIKHHSVCLCKVRDCYLDLYVKIYKKLTTCGAELDILIILSL